MVKLFYSENARSVSIENVTIYNSSLLTTAFEFAQTSSSIVLNLSGLTIQGSTFQAQDCWNPGCEGFICIAAWPGFNISATITNLNFLDNVKSSSGYGSALSLVAFKGYGNLSMNHVRMTNNTIVNKLLDFDGTVVDFDLSDVEIFNNSLYSSLIAFKSDFSVDRPTQVRLRKLNIEKNMVYNTSLIDIFNVMSDKSDSYSLSKSYFSIQNTSLSNNTFEQLGGFPISLISSYNLGLRITDSVFAQNTFNNTRLIELTDQMVTIVIANSSFSDLDIYAPITTHIFYKKQMDFNKNPIVDDENQRFVPNYGAFCMLNNTFSGNWRVYGGDVGFDLNVANFFIHDNVFSDLALESQALFAVYDIMSLEIIGKKMKILFSENQQKIVDPYLDDPLLLPLFERAIFENAKTDLNKSVSCVFSFSGNKIINTDLRTDSVIQIASINPDTLVDISRNTLLQVSGSQKSRKYDFINLFEMQIAQNLYIGSNTLSNSTANLIFATIGESAGEVANILVFNNTLEENYLIPFLDIDTHSQLNINIIRNRIQDSCFRHPVIHLGFKEEESAVKFSENTFQNLTVLAEGFWQAGIVIFNAQKKASCSMVIEECNFIENSLATKGLNPLLLGYKNSLVYLFSVKSKVQITNSTFYHNNAGSDTFFLTIYANIIEFSRLNFTKQEAWMEGTIGVPTTSIYAATMNLSVAHSTFQENNVQLGGGFYLDYLADYGTTPVNRSDTNLTTLTVFNNSFAGNKVDLGGAIYVKDLSGIYLSGQVSNNVFTSNQATKGSTIYINNIIVSKLVLRENIYNCYYPDEGVRVTGGDFYIFGLSQKFELKIQSVEISDSTIFVRNNLTSLILFDIAKVNYPPITFKNITFVSYDTPQTMATYPSTTLMRVVDSTVELWSINITGFYSKSSLFQAAEGAHITIHSSNITNFSCTSGGCLVEMVKLNPSIPNHINVQIRNTTIDNRAFVDINNDTGSSVIFINAEDAFLTLDNAYIYGCRGANGAVVNAAMKGATDSQPPSVSGRIVITFSVFESNSVKGSGGVIVQRGGSLEVYHSVFMSNAAHVSGGAIFISSFKDVAIHDSWFENNFVAFNNTYPMFGGALYIEVDQDYPNNASCFSISSNTFTKNYISFLEQIQSGGGGGGGAIFLHLHKKLPNDSRIFNEIQALPSSNSFSRNYADYGPDYSTSPVTCTFDSKNSTDITHRCTESPCSLDTQVWSEIFYNNYLRLNFTDMFGQRLAGAMNIGGQTPQPANVFKITLQISNQYQLYYDSNCTTYNCMINGNDLTMRGLGNESISLIFNVTNPIYPNLEFIVNTSFRPCQKGETNDTKQHTCIKCETGTFSLNPSDQVCSPCPPNAYCPGGAEIHPLPGYWRPSDTSPNIYECNRSESCNYTEYGSSICAPGYTGPFCLSCDLKNNYASSGFECVKCPPLWEGLLTLGSIQLLIFILEIGYIWYFRKINKSLIINNKYNKKFVDRVARGGYMTIILDYLQIITILKNYPLIMTGFITGVSHIGSPSQTLLYSADCVFLQLGTPIEDLFYTKLVAIVSLPFIKLGLCVLFAIVKKFLYKNYRFDAYLVVAVQCLILIEQPSMLYTLSSSLVCKSSDPLNPDQSSVPYYLRENPYVTCYSKNYYNYRNFLVIPMLIFWGICFPVCLSIILYRNRTKLKTNEFAMKLGSQYANYRRKYYYWNLVQLTQKFILIFFAQFAMLPLKTLGLTLFAMLIVFLMIINKFQPYRNVDLQKTYIRSIYVILFTTFLAVYGYEEDELNEFISTLIIIINGAFILFIAIKMLHLMGFRCISRVINKILNIFSSHPKKENFIYDDTYNHIDESVMHYEEQKESQIFGSTILKSRSSTMNKGQNKHK
mgnify:FL=1